MKKTLIMMVACLLCVAGASAATLSVNPQSPYIGETVTFAGNAGNGSFLFITGPNLPGETYPATDYYEGNMSVSGDFSVKMDTRLLDPMTYTVYLNEINGTSVSKEIMLVPPKLDIVIADPVVEYGDPIIIEITAGGSRDIKVATYHAMSGQLVDAQILRYTNDVPFQYSYTPKDMTGTYDIVVFHPGWYNKYAKPTPPATKGEFIASTQGIIIDARSKTDVDYSDTKRRCPDDSPGAIAVLNSVVISPAATPTPTQEPTPTFTPTPIVTPTPTPTVEPTQEPVEKTTELKEPIATQEPEVQATPDPQAEEILSELEEIKREQARIREAQEEQKGLLDAILDFLYGIFGIRR